MPDFFVILAIAFIIWGTLDTPETSSFMRYATVIIIMALALLVIAKYYVKVQTHKRYLNSGIREVDAMTGTDFEKFLAAHFRRMGYQTELTPISKDYGADIILRKDNDLYAVQAKRYNKKIGVKAIQELAAAINYYNASKGFVITNSFFSSNAKNFAKTNNIELWDRNRLIAEMIVHKSRELL